MPRISVVVPTCRRPDLMARCLDALAAQSLDRSDFEVIVVDDAGEEPTRRLVEGQGALYLATPGGPLGPASARNLGWRHASAPMIAFTDDDCLPDPAWLAEGLAALGHDEVAATGRVVVPIPEAPTDYERDAAGLAGAEFVTANLFCRRGALEAVGGFDERFAVAWREDSDLHFALIGRGGRIARAPLAVVVHPVRPARWGVSLGQQRKSLFDALLFRKHPALYRLKIRPGPPWDYYATVASAGLALLGLALGSRALALAAAGLWAGLTARFCLARLRWTTRRPGHVAEMVATSAAIPFLSVFWRLYGAWKFRARFF
ncbi:glycosyltransferase family 2 protein [Tundrisphaera sp. TA3]|uniref:glycosyltransferase family 2 protein n=1 Tax=Tundrisphaera sp. TA3 TaxID=3435775 RepID=UPI003EBE692F